MKRRAIVWLVLQHPMHYAFISGTFVSVATNMATGLWQGERSPRWQGTAAAVGFLMASFAWQGVAMSVEELRNIASVRQPPDRRSIEAAMFIEGKPSLHVRSSAARTAVAVAITLAAFVASRN